MSRNRVVIAAAGARKTQAIIDEALAAAPKQVLITTYTNENLHQLRRRIEAVAGVMPEHIRLAGWFSFLLSDGVRPYQVSVLPKVGLARGLNFLRDRPRYVKSDSWKYHLDERRDVWRDAVADFVCRANTESGGLVIERLERMYDHVFIDEVQDLVGYDLVVLDMLFAADLDVTAVGDPRQFLFSTNKSPKNRQYRGAGFMDWLAKRATVCEQEDRAVSYRCNQEICDFASDIFPSYPRIKSMHANATGHDGIKTITRFEALAYAAEHSPQVLRHGRNSDTQGLGGMNFGVSKGSTFDRVMIYPTTTMREYLEHRDPTRLKRPEALYVAVTRARYSATFVV